MEGAFNSGMPSFSFGLIVSIESMIHIAIFGSFFLQVFMYEAGTVKSKGKNVSIYMHGGQYVRLQSERGDSRPQNITLYFMADNLPFHF